MPILIAKGSTEPLSQGDLLDGIDLFTTGEDGTEACRVTRFKLALVVSRPCAAVNKAQRAPRGLRHFKTKIVAVDA